MADSSDSVSMDMATISLGGKEYLVKTRNGSVSVAIFGDQDKPALITYPDLALNYNSCFQGFFCLPEASSLLLHNFCVYHISPPGHELGADQISIDDHVLSVDDLTDQIADVLNFFGLGSVMCMGVTAGAYVLTLFAIKYRQRVCGLILISPIFQAPSWTEWLLNKVMSNLLYFYGIHAVVKELLLKRYFSKEACGSSVLPELDVVQTCRKFLGEMQPLNVCRFLEAINGPDLSEGLRKLQCRSLIFVGNNSPFHSEAIHMVSKLDRRCSALVEVLEIYTYPLVTESQFKLYGNGLSVQACGSVVTEEQPHAMLMSLEYFLIGYGLFRPALSVSPRSPLSLTCISPELLSPESMGVKLKPIRTRISGGI